MKLTKYQKEIDSMTRYGFEIAIKYAELAKEQGEDPIECMKKVLEEWESRNERN